TFSVTRWRAASPSAVNRSCVARESSRSTLSSSASWASSVTRASRPLPAALAATWPDGRTRTKVRTELRGCMRNSGARGAPGCGRRLEPLPILGLQRLEPDSQVGVGHVAELADLDDHTMDDI